MSDHIIRRYESLGAFVDYAETHRDKSGSSQTSGASWAGTASFNDAVNLARDGYRDIRPAVDGMAESIIGEVKAQLAVKPVQVFDVAGGAVDIGMFLNGEPECMLDMVLKPATGFGNVVTILINGRYSAGISAEQVKSLGIALCALVEILARCQTSAEIWIESSVSGNGGKYSSLVKLAEAWEPLDINGLMFAIAHPSFVRRICFGAEEGEPMHIRSKFGFTEHGGYGMPITPQCANVVGADLTVGSPSEYGRNASFGADWVISKLEALGLV